jgi:hypothetical protein
MNTLAMIAPSGAVIDPVWITAFIAQFVYLILCLIRNGQTQGFVPPERRRGHIGWGLTIEEEDHDHELV